MGDVSEVLIEKEKKRILWCDIYKGIVIVLVVVGHATGQFNQYIYQFHMAAFFFISGYTSDFFGKSFLEFAVKKFYVLLMPYLAINFMGMILFWVLQKLTILEYISTTEVPDSLWLVLTNHIQCDWLGAMWFLPILFGTSIVVKILIFVVDESRIKLFLLSFGFFLLSENVILTKGLQNMWFLVGIAQWFVVLGFLMKRIKICRLSMAYLIIFVVLIIFAWEGSVRKITSAMVDWPSGVFNGAVDAYIPVFGIALTIVVSMIFSRIKFLKNLFVVLGRNTMGIMCFHFIGFKLAYVILSILGIMKWNEFNRLTPEASVSQWTWWIITFIGVGFGMFFWNILNKNRILRFLFGGYEINLTKCMGNAANDNLFSKLYEQLRKSTEYMLAKLEKIRLVLVIGCCLTFIIGMFAGMKGLYENIEISFPDTSLMINYGEGWLEQSSSENYRWIENVSAFNLRLGRQENIAVKGYIPENVQSNTYFMIKVNGNVICNTKVTAGMEIDVDTSIEEYVKKYQINTVEFELDGRRIPETEDLDQREFSALISKIRFY